MMQLSLMEHFVIQRQHLTQINGQYLSQKTLEFASQIQILRKGIYFMWLKKEILFLLLIVMVQGFRVGQQQIILQDTLEIIGTHFESMLHQITQVLLQQVPVVERIPLFTRFIQMESTIVFEIRDGVFHKELVTQSRLKNGHLIEVEL